MTTYCVNATVSFAAWIYVDADDPDDAVAQAHSADASDFEHDPATATIEYNVTPEWEIA